MTGPAPDLQELIDITACPICGRDACEDHLPAEDASTEALSAPPEASLEPRIEEELVRLRVTREARRRLDADEHGAATIPAFQTLRDRLALPRDPVRYRIEGWMPRRGRVMLAAQFKAGKTTFVGNVIRSLVDDAAFLDRDRVVPIDGTLALIDTEMSGDDARQGQLDAWLADQGIREMDRVHPVPLRGRVAAFNLLDPHVRRDWAARFRGAGTTFLILDNLRPVLDALGLDEQREAGRFLVAFDALLAEAGIAEAIVVHHMGHNGERSRGDSRLRDWPDVEWRLVRQDDNPASPRFLTAYGRDVDQPEAQLAYDPQTRRLSLTGGSRRDIKHQDALGAVLVEMDAKGELSGRAVKTAFKDSDYSRAEIEGALKLGAKTVLATRPGPHNSILYSRRVPVSRSVLPVSQDSSVQCPSTYRCGTLVHTTDAVDGYGETR